MDVNPYTPPRRTRSADVPGDAVPGRGWRIYAVLLALLTAAGCVSNILDPERTARDVVDSVVSIPGLVGLIGFAYRRRFLTRRAWSVWAIVLPLWDLSYAFALLGPRDLSGRIGTVVGLSLCVPEYVALWRYAHRSRALWNPEPAATVVGQ